MSFPSVDDALIYLGYEASDASDAVVMAHVTHVLNAAIAMLKGAVGTDVDDLMPTDPRKTELIRQYMDDMSNTRGTSAKTANSLRRLTDTLESQLRLELSYLREHPPDPDPAGGEP